MNNKGKLTKRIIILCVTATIIGGTIFFYICYNKRNLYTNIRKESTNLQIEYTNEELTGEFAEYKAKINLDDEKTIIEGSGVTHSENTIKINSAGTYYITGSISDGNIVIEASKEDEVQLVLANAEITSKLTSPINGVEAAKLTITLLENTVNTITDCENYTYLTDAENSEPDGTIFTKTDLIINGTGKLIVNANYLDAIVSKDGLKILNTNIEVNSNDDAIRGKDYVVINNSDIKINSKGDGIKTTNDTDTELGYIAIEGGTININSEADGIQAQTILNISSETNINITTTGIISTNSNQIPEARMKAEQKVNTETTDDSTSSKALKAGIEITIENGSIKIVSTDDCIHSNGIIIINSGIIDLSSSDDAVHADTNIIINGGNINITKSYEAIESGYIEINGGKISAIASDDGINISGGNDGSSMDGRVGQNNFNQIEDSNKKLVINDGEVSINAMGDGLDSNGGIYINGGTVLVAGPTSGGNGALDYGLECNINGGYVIIYGSTGMWLNPSNSSTQNSLTFKISGNAGDKIILKQSNGKEVGTVETIKSYGAITFSSSDIINGETYSLYINGELETRLTADDVVTSDSSLSQNNMQQPGRMEQPGGREQINQPPEGRR